MEWSSTHLETILAMLVTVLFAVGGTINVLGSAAVKRDFERWGYPARFNYLCGSLELIGAALLLVQETRIWGLALLALVMVAALFTLLRNREPFRHLAPALVFSALIALTAAVHV